MKTIAADIYFVFCPLTTGKDLQIEVAGLQDKRYKEQEFSLGAKCLAEELIQTG